MNQTRISLIAVTCGAALLSAPGLAAGAAPQQDLSQVQIETQEIADGIYMLVGSGGNIGVSVGDDGVIIVDDQYAPLTDKIRAAIEAITDKPILFVINTHWHGDHTGGNESFGEAGSIIVAHDNVRKRMSSEQFSGFFGGSTPPSPDAALPVVTFTDSVTLHFNDEEIHVFHVDPAHTDGDSIVWFRNANVVHMGDVFFAGRYPFIDLGSGGSVDGMIDAANRVLESIDLETRIIPGHGPVSTIEDLQEYREVLTTVRARVMQHIAQGHSMDETIAARPGAEWDDTWGAGFINPQQFIEFVYASIMGR